MRRCRWEWLQGIDEALWPCYREPSTKGFELDWERRRKLVLGGGVVDICHGCKEKMLRKKVGRTKSNRGFEQRCWRENPAWQGRSAAGNVLYRNNFSFPDSNQSRDECPLRVGLIFVCPFSPNYSGSTPPRHERGGPREMMAWPVCVGQTAHCTNPWRAHGKDS